MGLQPTASRTDILLHCPRPFSDGVAIDRGTSDAARWGSAVHELLETHLRGVEVVDEVVGLAFPAIRAKWGIDDGKGLFLNVRNANRCLEAWCREGGNPFGVGLEVADVESPLGLRRYVEDTPPNWRSRGVTLDRGSHHYDLRPGEIGGTPDIVLRGGNGTSNWIVVVDLKTGDGPWELPASISQMRTLVAAVRMSPRWHRAGMRYAAAILSAPRDGSPAVMYAEEVPAIEVKRHLRALSVGLAKIGDGSIAPGPWCARCPARVGCPAQDARLVEQSTALLRLGGEELLRDAVDPGALHVFLQRFEALAARARAALREAVKRGDRVVRPDGKVLEIVTREFETLSKGTIVKALGKEAGEELLQELRGKGCIVTSEREELRAVAPEAPDAEGDGK